MARYVCIIILMCDYRWYNGKEMSGRDASSKIAIKNLNFQKTILRSMIVSYRWYQIIIIVTTLYLTVLHMHQDDSLTAKLVRWHIFQRIMLLHVKFYQHWRRKMRITYLLAKLNIVYLILGEYIKLLGDFNARRNIVLFYISMNVNKFN